MAVLVTMATPAISAAAEAAPVTVVRTGTITGPETPATDTTIGVTSEWPRCAFYAWGHTGYYPCGTTRSYADYTNGDREFFMLGMDWSVWHIWRNAGGWKSLGGHAYTSVANGVWFKATSPVIIQTIGTDTRWWCRSRGSGSWSGGWFRC